VNYALVYGQLIQRAISREVIGYTEKHHIIPKCMGGTNASKNIVRLTAREHFIAHRLLTRMYPDVRGTWYALIAMGRLAAFKSKIFASERQKAANCRRGTKYTEESRQKMSIAKAGKPSVSPNTCFKPGQPSWSKGKMGEEAPGYGTRRTLEQRLRMGQAQIACGNTPPSRKGIKWTAAQKVSASIKRKASRLIGELP
jgi:hypothetical protein